MGPVETDDEPRIRIENVSEGGIRIALDDGDVFLPFAGYPVIANAPVSTIFDVRIRRPGHLFWPALDFEVAIVSLPPYDVQYATRESDRASSVRETPAVDGPLRIAVPREAIARFCRERGIRRLAFFGSVVREDFTRESDVDVLVEFEPGRRTGLIKLAGYQAELAEILGRRVDLYTLGMIGRHRDTVLAEAVFEYDAGA